MLCCNHLAFRMSPGALVPTCSCDDMVSESLQTGTTFWNWFVLLQMQLLTVTATKTCVCFYTLEIRIQIYDMYIFIVIGFISFLLVRKNDVGIVAFLLVDVVTNGLVTGVSIKLY